MESVTNSDEKAEVEMLKQSIIDRYHAAVGRSVRLAFVEFRAELEEKGFSQDSEIVAYLIKTYKTLLPVSDDDPLHKIKA